MPVSYIFDHEHSNFRQEKLKQLLQQAKKQAKLEQQENFHITVEEIVDLVLCSRPICRLYNGQPLFGIYLEIYDQVRGELLPTITKQIEQSNQLPQTHQWLYFLQASAFQSVLYDANLKKLALAAQSTPPNSGLRSYALRELVKAIKLSQKLIRIRQQESSSQFEKLIYEEAVTETLAYICTKIELYDSERGNKKFMNWVNFKLEKTLIQCRNQYSNPSTRELYSGSDLENIVHQKNTPNLSELLYQYIEQDSNNMFKSVFIKGNPQANFQQIALARLSGHSWKEIAQELKLSVSSLSSFFQRNCRKFKPLFEKEFKS
ncbi:MAG: hypothetical protein QNJ70_04100 [Xenococcaceae cyanobacterium MO_207.B15]|nr:hypothetical protein [Xenococcaceae cyanobacterium MO_207.B15]MDJ0746457.1 hypothetical protein [Xenococcaceae cyanobacterium MO_167.B27]